MTGESSRIYCTTSTRSAESGDGARFARHFKPRNAIYHDYIYGRPSRPCRIAPYYGRSVSSIRRLSIGDVRSRMRGEKGDAWSLSSFTLEIPQFKAAAS